MFDKGKWIYGVVWAMLRSPGAVTVVRVGWRVPPGVKLPHLQYTVNDSGPSEDLAIPAEAYDLSITARGFDPRTHVTKEELERELRQLLDDQHVGNATDLQLGRPPDERPGGTSFIVTLTPKPQSD